MHSVQSDQELAIDAIQLRKGALVYRAINHSLRQQILRLMHRFGTMTVSELYTKLRMEQSVASQHLAILRKTNIVIAERKAKNIFYSVNYEQLDNLHTVTASLING